MSRSVIKEFGWRHALGRAGTIDEAAQMLTFLIGPKSTFTTGTVINVDGADP